MKPIIFVITLQLFLGSIIFAQEQGIMVETEFCRGIEDRMPVEPADSFPSDVEQVYLWSKIVGVSDSTIITYLWLYNDQEMATVELPVKSSSWRTWSSKKILPAWIGNWEVRISDMEGNILKSVTFEIVSPTVEEELPDTTEPASPPADTGK